MIDPGITFLNKVAHQSKTSSAVAVDPVLILTLFALVKEGRYACINHPQAPIDSFDSCANCQLRELQGTL